jgi:hypothetical protein
MKTVIRTADSKGRVALPGFANATLIVEKVDDTEYRVRKARVIPEKEMHFHEQDAPVQLSAPDAAALISALENPPKPNATARRAAKDFMRQYGRLGHRKTKRPS